MSEQTDALAKFARDHGLQVPLGFDSAPDYAEEDLLDKLWVETVGNGRRLGGFARAVGLVMAQDGIYRRDRVPITINAETGSMEPMDDQRFRSYVEHKIVCWKWQSHGRAGMKKVPETMPGGDSQGVPEE